MPEYDFKCDRCNRVETKESKEDFPCDCNSGTLRLVSKPDSEQEFKCRECDKLEKRTIKWINKGDQICKCGGKMNMQIDFSGVGIISKFNPPYKPGTNAREDRKRAFIAQEEQGKLPKDINEHNANFADLL